MGTLAAFQGGSHFLRRVKAFLNENGDAPSV